MLKSFFAGRTARLSRFVMMAVLALGGLALAAVPTAAGAAGSATYSLSPASGSFTIGTSYTIAVYETSTDQVNAVEADLVYNASQLQFNSVDTSGTPFGGVIPNSNGSGSVKISAADLGASVTGTQLVGKISFTVLAGSGTTSITFAGSSQIVRTSDTVNVWDGNPAGGGYTLTGASSGGGGTTTGGGSSGGTSGGSSKGATKAPAVPAPTTTATPTNPTPVPTASTPAPVVNSYYIGVKILDADGKPLQGAVVTMGGITSTSNSEGISSFNLPPGNYTASIAYKGKKASLAVAVSATTTPSTPQQFQVKVAGVHATNWLLYIGLIVLLLVIIGGGTFLLRLVANRPPKLPTGSSGSTVAGVSTVTTPPPAPPANPVLDAVVNDQPAAARTTGAGQIFYPDASNAPATNDPAAGGPTDGQA